MKIISFDIGIKNMAYCIISNTNDNKNPIIIFFRSLLFNLNRGGGVNPIFLKYK